jgi:hypothetical protein
MAYLHPGNGSYSAIDLTVTDPSLLLDFCSSNKRNKCSHEMSFHILRVFLCENEFQNQFLVVLIRCGTHFRTRTLVECGRTFHGYICYVYLRNTELSLYSPCPKLTRGHITITSYHGFSVFLK